MKTYRIKFNFMQLKRSGISKQMRGWVDYETDSIPHVMQRDPELHKSLVQHAETSTDCKVLSLEIASIEER